MRRVKKLSDVVSYLEDRNIDLDDVLIDPNAMQIVEPDEDDQRDLDDDG